MNKEELKELAATLNGIADGKAWEFTGHGTLSDDWFEANNDQNPLILSCHFGRRIRLKPWSLPPPPDGMQWHRDDWTKEMLGGGWRPHLLGEVDNGDEEFLIAGEWKSCYYGSSAPTEASDNHRRTKAPLPPKKKKVPLGPSDVPPGTVLRGAGEAATPEHQGWCMITSSSLTGIRIWRHSDSSQTEIKWETLMNAGSEIWRPTDTEWQPCYKLIDTP